MTHSQAQINAALARLHDDPQIIGRIRNEIEKIEIDAKLFGYIEWTNEPPELSSAVISQAVKLAKTNLQNEDRASRLLRVEQALAEVRDLSERKIAWAKELLSKRAEDREHDRLEAVRRHLNDQWPINGQGKPMLDALAKTQRELDVARGALKFDVDLRAWRTDIAHAAADMLAEIDAAIEVIQPKAAKSKTKEAA